MTDIIERLEARYRETSEPECDLLQEAALEIEQMNGWQNIAIRIAEQLEEVRVENDALHAEIERLKGELDAIESALATG